MATKNPKEPIYEDRMTEHVIPNPLWLQILTYLAVLSLLCITILSSIWIVDLVKTEGLISIGGIPVIILFAGYGSYVGLLILRYKSAHVTYNRNSFTVIQNGSESSYEWSEVTKAKYHGMCRVLKLYDDRGKTIYTIHNITPANRKFARKISETVGYTNDIF